MKKFSFALIAAGTLLLSGCQTSELGERAIIQAAAVDFRGGEYVVSALMFSSGGGSQEGLDASGENVIKVTGTGDTLAQAVENISLTDGREVYMRENKLLIIGSGFEDADFTPAVEALSRDMRCSLNMPVCYSDDPELLTDLHFKEGITSAEKPVSMIENSYNAGASPKTCLLDLLNDAAAGRCTLLPMFSRTVNGFGMTADENGETAVITGSRVYYCGNLYERLDGEQTSGEMLLFGLTDKTRLYFRHAGGEQSCEAYSVRAKLRDNGDVVLSARFRKPSGEALPAELKTAAFAELERLIRSAPGIL